MSSALVPYIARSRVQWQLAKMARLNRRYVAAKRIARFVYKHRRPIWRGTKRGARAVIRASKRARFGRSQIGERIGTSNSKTALQVNTDGTTLFNSGQLYVQNLVLLSKTTDNEIDGRQRDLAKLSGVKMCFEVTNVDPSPMYMNFAVVRSKDETVPDVTNFFRSYDNSRSIDFSQALSGLQFHCLPLNTDKFNILWHKRMRVNGAIDNETQSPYDQKSGRSYLNFSKYIKIQRQMRYNGTQNFPENGNISLVYWFTKFGKAAGTGPTPNTVQLGEHHILYWRETRGG